MPAFFKCLICLGLAAFALASPAQDSLPALHARAVDLCDEPSTCAQIGKLRLRGVLELPSVKIGDLRFSQLSGLAWDDDDGILYALSDKGMLFGLRPTFRDERLVDVELASAAWLIDPKTGKRVRYRRADSEGLDIINGRNGRKGDAELLVSFEGVPRLARHRPDGRVIAEVPLASPLKDLGQYRYNRMLEAVCVHPREGILTAPEEPLLVDNGQERLYRIDGRSWNLPALRGGIVALECMPDGDILLLEREFTSFTLHLRATLHRLRLPGNTPPGRTLQSETLATLDNSDGLRIDNFEGLARHRGNRFFMVSDNNDVFVQRTLLMYFELLP